MDGLFLWWKSQIEMTRKIRRDGEDVLSLLSWEAHSPLLAATGVALLSFLTIECYFVFYFFAATCPSANLSCCNCDTIPSITSICDLDSKVSKRNRKVVTGFVGREANSLPARCFGSALRRLPPFRMNLSAAAGKHFDVSVAGRDENRETPPPQEVGVHFHYWKKCPVRSDSNRKRPAFSGRGSARKA